MREKVADRDRLRRVYDLVAAILPGDGDAGGGELGQEVAYGLPDEQRTALLQHHDGGTDHGLRHGRDTEDGVCLHRGTHVAVAKPDGAVVDGAPVVGDLQDGTR